MWSVITSQKLTLSSALIRISQQYVRLCCLCKNSSAQAPQEASDYCRLDNQAGRAVLTETDTSTLNNCNTPKILHVCRLLGLLRSAAKRVPHARTLFAMQTPAAPVTQACASTHPDQHSMPAISAVAANPELASINVSQTSWRRRRMDRGWI